MSTIRINNLFTQIAFIIYLFASKYLFLELSYLIGCFFLIISILIYKKINQTILFTVLGLITIVCIGLISGLLNDNIIPTKAYLKDFVYFTKPIIVLTTSFILIKNTSDITFFSKAIIFFAIITAIIHLLGVLFYIPQIGFSVAGLRSRLGLGNNIEVFAFILLLINDKNSILYVNIKNKLILILILFFSIAFYFSRTDFILLIILWIGLKGYYRPKLKTFSFLAIFIIFTSVLFYSLSFVNVSYKNQNGINSFIYKIKNTPNEMFQSKIDKNDLRDLWHNWRAYEAKMAIDQTNGFRNQMIGNGFGSLVDLKIEAELGERIRRIPILHNGYIYIYFKTGYLGIIAYIMIFIHLFMIGFIKKDSEKELHYFIASLSLCIFFTTFVITGIYNSFDLLLLYLGGILALYSKTKSLVKA